MYQGFPRKKIEGGIFEKCADGVVNHREAGVHAVLRGPGASPLENLLK